MTALAKRRPDYRNNTAQALKARVHDDLRECLSKRLIRESQEAREELFWDAVIADFERDMEGFHAYA